MTSAPSEATIVNRIESNLLSAEWPSSTARCSKWLFECGVVMRPIASVCVCVFSSGSYFWKPRSQEQEDQQRMRGRGWVMGWQNTPQLRSSLVFFTPRTQNTRNDYHQWLSDSSRVHQTRFRPGLRPGRRWESLQRSTEPLV